MAKQNLGMVTAYAYAMAGGYTGTEAEFEALLGNIATDLEEIENLTVTATTLPEGSSATASYSDGVLTLGIPKGDTGATGAGATATAGTTTTGLPGTNASVVNSGTTKDAVFDFTIPRGDTGNGIESIELTDTQGAVKTYTILFTDGNTTTFDVTDGEVTNATLTAVLADYAKIDGYYESLGSGTADQLASNIYEEDSVPYNFRTSGGSIDIGDRETDMLVGGTVAWNQLAPEADFSTHNHWWKGNGCDSVTFSNGIATVVTLQDPTPATIYNRLIDCDGIRYVKDHAYLACYEYKLNAQIPSGIVPRATIQTYMPIFTTQGKDVTSNNWETFARVFKATESSGTSSVLTRFRIDMGASYTDSYEYQLRRPQVFDLTQMFGSTIADYIYSLEQSQAGAGVAWFRKLFPKPYYPYNAGELMSVQASSHDMVGFNAWDGEYQGGYWDALTGEYTASANWACSKNPIPVVPNTTYYCKSDASKSESRGRIIFYDADMNWIDSRNGVVNSTFTTPNNSHYIHFYMNPVFFSSNDKICFNLSWDGERDGEYEAYVKHSYPLDSSLTLRGIPKLDASNNLYYDGDTYEADGTVTRKYGYKRFTNGEPSTIIYSVTVGTDKTRVVCNVDALPNAKSGAYLRFQSNAFVYDYNSNPDIGMAAINNGFLLFGAPDTVTTKEEAVVYLASVNAEFVYELATPTTETADSYTNPQIVDDFGTEEYVDYAVSQGDRDVSIPVGHYTQYMANLKAKLEMSPNSPEGAGDYIVRQTNGENEYVTLASNATIQDIIARLEALENA